MAYRAEVLLDAHPRRWAGCRTIGVVRGRHREPPVELAEGGVARATESIDRLVVVAHDHHVVGAVRRPAQQLDELDLGDVGVLELVHQQVSELALPAPEQVRPHLEQLRDGGDHLAIVERAPGDQLRLVRPVDGRELRQAHHLQGGAVDDVCARELIDLVVPLKRDLLPGDRPTGATDGATRLPVGGLGHGVRVIGGCRAGILCPFRTSEGRIGAPDVPWTSQVALGPEPERGVLVAAVSVLEDRELLGDEPLEVGRRDQLVLGPIDELHELRERPIGVVDRAAAAAGCHAAAGTGRCRRGRRGWRACWLPPLTPTGSDGRSCGSSRRSGELRRRPRAPDRVDPGAPWWP